MPFFLKLFLPLSFLISAAPPHGAAKSKAAAAAGRPLRQQTSGREAPAAAPAAADAVKTLPAAAAGPLAAPANQMKGSKAQAAKGRAAAAPNLKSAFKSLRKQTPSQAKHWLLVSEGCSSCDSALKSLQKICSGGKPGKSKVGFFVIGENEQKMQAKLKGYEGHEAFLGSTAEFYMHYGLQGSPALLARGKKEPIMGKTALIAYLKKDPRLCEKQ